MSSTPLPRPSIDFTPRISAKNHVQRLAVSVKPKPRPAPPSLPSSGNPLARPCTPLSNSSRPFRSLNDANPVALTRPPPGHADPLSLHLPRELPDFTEKARSHQQSVNATIAMSSQSQTTLKRPRAAPAVTSVELSRARRASDASAVQALIPKFLTIYTGFSTLLSKLSSSDNGHDHLLRILDGFAPTTSFRQISSLLAFAALCENMHIQLAMLDDIILADLLMTGASEAGKYSPMTLKAIRWGWKLFALSCFKECFSTVVNSFTKTKFTSERRESLPLLLIVLIQWERRVLQSSASTLEVLVLGTFFVMTFSGMRFGDIQRIMLGRVQYDGNTLRGVSWKTKTCNSGVPFGIICKGFLSKGTHHWVHKFLTCLDSVMCHQHSESIDFLLPSFQGDAVREPLIAMPYSEALFHLRAFMVLPWRSVQLQFANATHYTIHGLKSTFLSWSAQLRIDHKDPLQSTRLYSRDDIEGALHLQEELCSQIIGGWRPKTPLSRGGICCISGGRSPRHDNIQRIAIRTHLDFICGLKIDMCSFLVSGLTHPGC